MIDSFAALLGLGAKDPVFWMPLVIIAVFFVTLVLGVLLDGFDIGVACLALVAPADLRPRMLALLAPWRDANEFWLFLGIGLMAAAFPQVWPATIGKLYVPLSLLALGTLLRSVCFEWRLRAPEPQQALWQFGFSLGALLCAFAHGYLLAEVALSYKTGLPESGFAILMGCCAVASYSLLGATWLIMREPGGIRMRSVAWARSTIRWCAVGVVAISVALDLSNPGVFLKWGDNSNWLAIIIAWGVLLLSFVSTEMYLQRLLNHSYRATAVPYILVLLILLTVLAGLAYSMFPYFVLDELSLWDAAAPVGTLSLVLSAILLVLPIAIIFNLRVYWRVLGQSKKPRLPTFDPKW